MRYRCIRHLECFWRLRYPWMQGVEKIERVVEVLILKTYSLEVNCQGSSAIRGHLHSFHFHSWSTSSQLFLAMGSWVCCLVESDLASNARDTALCSAFHASLRFGAVAEAINCLSRAFSHSPGNRFVKFSEVYNLIGFEANVGYV